VYVDYIILAGNGKEEIERIKQALNHTFKIKDLWDLRYFLCLEIAKSKKGIVMNKKICIRIVNRCRSFYPTNLHFN